MIHHEAIVAGASSILLPAIAWGLLAVNAAVYYAKRFINRRK